ncbi:phosphotransferase, partial [Henriciella sp.]|uniref:phosphotransferase n=1 Tax=Henriciella sp. TaxID=1968823 RepID=UPI0018517196
MSLLKHAPTLSLDQARQVAVRNYDLTVLEVNPLPSERDQNFLLDCTADQRFVLKVSNELEDRSLLDGQNAMLMHLSMHLDVCPIVVPDRDNNAIGEFEFGTTKHMVRLVTFLLGQPLVVISYRSPELLSDLGRRVGQITDALKDFDRQAFHRSFYWDLANARKIVADGFGQIVDQELRQDIEHLVAQFDRYSASLLHELPMSVIHNDCNDGNVIVSESDTVAGIIDFGDAVYSWKVGELAIAIAYAILDQPDPLSSAALMVASYHKESKLTTSEIGALFGLVCLRLCVSAVIAAEQQQQRPDDPYLSSSQGPIRKTLPLLRAIPFPIATATFRRACGLKPLPRNAVEWLQQTRTYAFPIGRNSAESEVSVLDLSVSSTLMPQDVESLTTLDLTKLLFDQLDSQGAEIGVGQYLEPRIVYGSEQFGAVDNLELERRTVHLGIDLFATDGTPVVSPLGGTVHCVAQTG